MHVTTWLLNPAAPGQQTALSAAETQPIVATKQLDRTSKAVPIRFSVAIGSVPPGRYDCQVTVIDPIGRKAAFWRRRS